MSRSKPGGMAIDSLISRVSAEPEPEAAVLVNAFQELGSVPSDGQQNLDALREKLTQKMTTMRSRGRCEAKIMTDGEVDDAIKDVATAAELQDIIHGPSAFVEKLDAGCCVQDARKIARKNGWAVFQLNRAAKLLTYQLPDRAAQKKELTVWCPKWSQKKSTDRIVYRGDSRADHGKSQAGKVSWEERNWEKFASAFKQTVQHQKDTTTTALLGLVELPCGLEVAVLVDSEAGDEHGWDLLLDALRKPERQELRRAGTLFEFVQKCAEVRPTLDGLLRFVEKGSEGVSKLQHLVADDSDAFLRDGVFGSEMETFLTKTMQRAASREHADAIHKSGEIVHGVIADAIAGKSGWSSRSCELARIVLCLRPLWVIMKWVSHQIGPNFLADQSLDSALSMLFDLSSFEEAVSTAAFLVSPTIVLVVLLPHVWVLPWGKICTVWSRMFWNPASREIGMRNEQGESLFPAAFQVSLALDLAALLFVLALVASLKGACNAEQEASSFPKRVFGEACFIAAVYFYYYMTVASYKNALLHIEPLGNTKGWDIKVRVPAADDEDISHSFFDFDQLDCNLQQARKYLDAAFNSGDTCVAQKGIAYSSSALLVTALIAFGRTVEGERTERQPAEQETDDFNDLFVIGCAARGTFEAMTGIILTDLFPLPAAEAAFKDAMESCEKAMSDTQQQVKLLHAHCKDAKDRQAQRKSERCKEDVEKERQKEQQMRELLGKSDRVTISLNMLQDVVEYGAAWYSYRMRTIAEASIHELIPAELGVNVLQGMQKKIQDQINKKLPEIRDEFQKSTHRATSSMRADCERRYRDRVEKECDPFLTLSGNEDAGVCI